MGAPSVMITLSKTTQKADDTRAANFVSGTKSLLLVVTLFKSSSDWT
jgi:hypothetical protein